MAYELEYHDSGFHLTHTGVVSIGEINEVNGEIQDSVHFDEHTYQLIDLLQADFSKVVQSHSEMPGATDAVASMRNNEVRVAIVATDPPAVSFCEHYIEAANSMGSTWSFAIFPDKASALKWAKA